MVLTHVILEIHTGCFQLCKQAIGRYLPIAGNIGIFCQDESEYHSFTRLREELTVPSNNPNQKYYQLKEPVVVDALGDMPQTIYTHLYVRKPASDSPQRGDVDFVLPQDEYLALKERILGGEKVPGARMYDRPGWDTIEIRNPTIRAISYISTQEMAEKVRVKF